MGAADRVLHVGSPSFDMSVEAIVCPLASGASVVFAHRDASSEIGALVAVCRSHAMSST